jgi:hypothetical protein
MSSKVLIAPAKAMLGLADRYLGVTTPRRDSAEAPKSPCGSPTTAPPHGLASRVALTPWGEFPVQSLWAKVAA